MGEGHSEEKLEFGFLLDVRMLLRKNHVGTKCLVSKVVLR